MEDLAISLYYLGMIGSLIGSLWFLFEAFQVNIIWGLACIFLPIV